MRGKKKKEKFVTFVTDLANLMFLCLYFNNNTHVKAVYATKSEIPIRRLIYKNKLQ